MKPAEEEGKELTMEGGVTKESLCVYAYMYTQ